MVEPHPARRLLADHPGGRGGAIGKLGGLDGALACLRYGVPEGETSG